METANSAETITSGNQTWLENPATSTTIGRGRHAVTPDTTGRNAGERCRRGNEGVYQWPGI